VLLLTGGAVAAWAGACQWSDGGIGGVSSSSATPGTPGPATSGTGHPAYSPLRLNSAPPELLPADGS